MSKSTNLFFAEVLDKQRLEILPYLAPFKDLHFYLAGGTALALLLWHRKSVDFDFFTPNQIDTQQLFQLCQKIFSDFTVKKIFEEENTLYITVNGVKISFITYEYPHVEACIETPYLSLASIEDIGTMKLSAIQNRSTNKDYVDLYVTIKKIWLQRLLEVFFQKFGDVVSDSYLLKALIYFDDIKEEPLLINDSTLTFDTVKTWLEQAVKDLKLHHH